jgi:hypothetical protein
VLRLLAVEERVLDLRMGLELFDDLGATGHVERGGPLASRFPVLRER